MDTASDRVHAVAGSAPFYILDVRKLPGKTVQEDLRRIRLVDETRRYLTRLPAMSHVFCEQPLALRTNGRTTVLLCKAAGAIWTTHLGLDLTWWWVDNNTWKSEVLGFKLKKGKEGKRQIQEWVHEEHGVEFDCEDLYDAFCIKLYGEKVLAQEGLWTPPS